MSYLIDTDVVADWLNNRPTAVHLLPSLEPAGLAISLITYGEVYDGIYDGRDPHAAERAFVQFLRRVEVLSLTRTIMKRFARIRGSLRRQGLAVQDPDLLIAATALTHHMTLVTRNLRQFQRIPGLTIFAES
jgi:tRNA(fMet)-specific endonuclease VapC